MITKTIHLCWFSNEPFPLEIKICIESWKRVLPDYTIRRWTYEDAQAIGCRFINEALAAKKWAFAADAVRFYALYKEGGVYADSDIYIKKRFDQFIPDFGFVSFHEHIRSVIQLQAAFLIGEKGNKYCKDLFDYYNHRPFLKPDGSYDTRISPDIMVEIARNIGYKQEDTEQHLKDDVTIYPGYFVTPCKSRKNAIPHPDAFAEHKIYGSWRKRKFGRKIEIWIKHIILYTQFILSK